MIIEFSLIAMIGVSYLLILFGIAYITDKGWMPNAINQHPVTYILSMGIFASAWAYYGMVDLAGEFGYGALAYYLGTGVFFLFSPIIQAPLAKLARQYQLVSIADLLTFRYQSRRVGALATLCMLFAVLPLMILQIQAVADTLNLMSFNRPAPNFNFLGNLNQRDTLALFYCLLVTLFCLMFGTNPKRYSSLINAMAFESLVKVTALLSVGAFAVYGVFGSFNELDSWLANNPIHLKNLNSPSENTVSHSLLLIFTATGLLMPHIFQMSQSNISIDRLSRTITWGFPLFLLLMAIPIYPILWAGNKLEITTTVDYFTLGVPLAAGAEWISIFAFIGGLSAASGALIVGLVSVSTMVLNHWLLPFLPFKPEKDLYAELRWLRRIIILLIGVLGYNFYRLLSSNFSLTDLALLAFIEALQFLPGVIAINQWPRGHRFGLLAGLSTGTLIWLLGLTLPVITGQSMSFDIGSLTITTGMQEWHTLTIIALGCNSLVFVVISLLFKQNDEEKLNADICADDALSSPTRQLLQVQTIDDFYRQLTPALGTRVTEKEMERALRYLKLNRNERRPFALRRLRNRLEINLTGLVGQARASDIINAQLPYQANTQQVTDINLIEKRLERSSSKLTGLAADINRLRLYHRDTLQTLPLAICSLGKDGEVLMWNDAMSQLTGTHQEDIVGADLSSLPNPWQSLIKDFVYDPVLETDKRKLVLDVQPYWYRLHKSIIADHDQETDGQVIMIEDVTETEKLEQELVHQGRLASIGRLAAGVAHEIGNPVTGIACLAQNLPYEETEQERETTAQQILAQTERISRIVSSLVSFAHSGQQVTHDIAPVNLHDCVTEAIALLSLQKDNTQVTYHNYLKGNEVIEGDAQRMIQVFVNLLSNARDACTDGDTIDISSYQHQQKLIIDVIDPGAGIAPEHMSSLMEPFFTTKDAGKGTGLGLALVYSIIEDHNGQISVKSPITDQGGTCFTLMFTGYQDEGATSDPH